MTASEIRARVAAPPSIPEREKVLEALRIGLENTYRLGNRGENVAEDERTLESAIAALDASRARDADPLAGFEQYEEPNWDGYGADPVSAETTRAARLLVVALAGRVAPPHVAPGADGSVGLEWVFDVGQLRKVFVDVGPGASWSAYWRSDSVRSTVARKQIDASTADEIVQVLAGAAPGDG